MNNSGITLTSTIMKLATINWNNNLLIGMSGIGVGIVCMSRSHLQFYVCPYNINYVWNMGFLLFLFIGIQIITGIVLSWHYCSDIQVSYYSIQYLGREVYYGWCLYYIHSSGASFIFGSLIFHVGRGLYVSSNLF